MATGPALRKCVGSVNNSALQHLQAQPVATSHNAIDLQASMITIPTARYTYFSQAYEPRKKREASIRDRCQGLRKIRHQIITLAGLLHATHRFAHSSRCAAQPTLNRGSPLNIIASPQEQLLLTPKQAAQRLAICRRTLERLIASGEFPPPLKIGRASRVSVNDVQAYVARLLKVRSP